MNTALAGEPGWSPLPERMEQLRRSVTAPGEYAVPPHLDAEQAAVFMGRLEEAGRRLATLPDARATATACRAARDEARRVLREAWRLGVEHQVQLDVLEAVGLLAYGTPRAAPRGWCPEGPPTLKP